MYVPAVSGVSWGTKLPDCLSLLANAGICRRRSPASQIGNFMLEGTESYVAHCHHLGWPRGCNNTRASLGLSDPAQWARCHSYCGSATGGTYLCELSVSAALSTVYKTRTRVFGTVVAALFLPGRPPRNDFLMALASFLRRPLRRRLIARDVQGSGFCSRYWGKLRNADLSC